ncbi:UPF0454 protein C12orf49 homolog [Varroa jacobsoni]|uniref:SREBP regulating gene protein n=1 Tax=Varroa destructor TaxID=109461 RepID=A0A7M7KUS9_VARDE|nr:UPF0454 protein C12orf49 homolog [Varroa destructor]XP_022672281.1 UPF0454 protein C12orf49 homolog [Varroa destructor]XP_022696214.1 UPF0454 protein C12orf49 homolog [Varroa jacobsoni]XP_022696215.1 UPF0454 protein C12orf49 homolog [Varroa jacobsoni]
MVFLRGANNDGGGVGGSVIGHSGTTTNTAGSNAASWGSGVMRLLRRRTVLGFIFCASLLYCVVTVLRDQNEADRVNQFGSDHEANSGKTGGAVPLPALSFRWNSNTSVGDINVATQNQEQNRNSISACKNTLQGAVWVADDRGFVCNRSLLLSNGCCDNFNGLLERYPCWSCTSGCCSSYEICVSCCLRPQQRPLLEKVLGRLGRSPKALQLFVLVRTHFDLCLAKCRTSSRSVRNENTYIDPENKYCFGEEEALTDTNKKAIATGG